MTPGTNTLRTLFEQTLALPAHARREFLDEHCDDADLRAAHRAHDRRRRRTTTSRSSKASTGSRARSARRTQRRLAARQPRRSVRPRRSARRRRLVDGVSRRARRSRRDASASRSSCCGADSIRRMRKRQFRRERRALAQLQHPGIARLIEGGVTETGHAVHRARTGRWRADHRLCTQPSTRSARTAASCSCMSAARSKRRIAR